MLGRPRPGMHLHKPPKAQWALLGGIGAPLGVFLQRNCMSISLNRGEVCISSLVWLCLGGLGRPDRTCRRWRSMGVTYELPQPPWGLVGALGGAFSTKLHVDFTQIEAKMCISLLVQLCVGH